MESIPWDLQLCFGEALVQTLYISIDAALRTFLDEESPYSITVGDVMKSPGVGVVKDVAEGCQFKVGDYVFYRPGWRFISGLSKATVDSLLWTLDRMERLGSLQMGRTQGDPVSSRRSFYSSSR